MERARLFLTTKRERELWYDHGFQKAIETLGTTHLASEYPATIEAEHARAKKRSGQVSWTTKMLDESFVPQFAGEIRHQISTNWNLPENDRKWASDFFFIHMIQGVKYANIHHFNDAEGGLERFLASSNIQPTAMENGRWWIDVGIEISSSQGHCIQWRTAGHCAMVRMTLGVTEQKASTMTKV